MMSAADQTLSRAARAQEVRRRIDGKAKPLGALGRLEDIAVQIALATGSAAPVLGPPKIIVFAGDHGITAEGVTAYPSAVTREIAKLILAGSAGINLCARAAGADVMLVDAGLLEALPAHAKLIARRLAAGTNNALHMPAMDVATRDAALAYGAEIVGDVVGGGSRLLAFGEVGIGNTSASALVAHAVTGLGLDVLVGSGSGAPPLGLDHKRAVLAAAFARADFRASSAAARAEQALAEFAGFEMVMMAGAFAAAVDLQCIVVVDGFIATAVAAAAIARDARVREHCVFAHCSAEAGHAALLRTLDADPLLSLGLRLGEGTGAALALPIVKAAAALLTDMADLPGEHPK